MILSREEIARVSEMRTGSLSEVPYAILLTALARRGETLLLELRRRQFEKKVVFESGTAVDCRSNMAHETLGRFMVSNGSLSETDLRECFSQSTTRGVPLGEVLVERELVTPVGLYRILQQNLARKLLDGFTWREGEFEISTDVPEVQSTLKVRVPQLVLTGIAKFAPQEEIDRAIAPLVGKQLVLHPEPIFSAIELKLTRPQQKLAAAVGEGRRIDELAEATELPWELVSRIVCALSVMGVVTSIDKLPAGVMPGKADFALLEESIPGTVPTPKVEEQPESTTEVKPEEAERRRNELMQLYLAFRKQDPFDLFGLDESAQQGEIEIAFLDFSARFAPWSYSDPMLVNLIDKASEIFLAGARGYAVLASSVERTSLVSQRRNRREEKKRDGTANRFQIQTDLLDPEQQYSKGKVLVEAGKHAEAISFLEFAADCDAQNGTYRAELAYARFLQSPMITTGGRSLGELGEAMRIDPSCGLSWYYAGMIHARLGQNEKAAVHLRGAIKKMAPNRRPIEALKALGKE